MKKIKFLIPTLSALLLLTACSVSASEGVTEGLIGVVSREEGSGARGAFEELVEVNTSDETMMRDDAIIQNGNGTVATFVSSNPSALGYISFATYTSRKDDLKGLQIDGYYPSKENVLAGDYSLYRPFNFVFMPEHISDAERAFIEFATSRDGAEIVDGLGAVVDIESAEYFDASKWDLEPTTIIAGGSTSTEETAIALLQEFAAIFPQIEYRYQATGSGAGITGAQDGTYHIGFASREIKDSEMEGGLNVVAYCLDAMVVIVHPSNPLEGITAEQLHDVYVGKINDWAHLH